MSDIQHVSKLPQAPLQEVVFEARWKPDVGEQTELPYDNEFDVAQGKLQERLEEDFTYHRRLITNPVAIPFLTGQIVHQFWAAEGKFPIVQFGPCIVTVNQVGKEYQWEEGFKPLIRRTLERLFDSYKGQLKLSEVKLFYIDAIDLPDSQNVLDHLQKVKVTLQFHVDEYNNPSGLTVDFGYRVEHDSTLQLSIRTATNNKTGNPALVWNTAIHRGNCGAWNDDQDVVESVMQWCSYAHSVASDLFKKMTQGNLYDSFL